MSYQGKDNAHTEEKRSKLHYKIIFPGELEFIQS